MQCSTSHVLGTLSGADYVCQRVSEHASPKAERSMSEARVVALHDMHPIGHDVPIPSPKCALQISPLLQSRCNLVNCMRSTILIVLPLCNSCCVAHLFAGSATIGATEGGSTLQVYAATTFEPTSGPITANAAVVANLGLTVGGNSVLGRSSADELTINAAATFTQQRTVLYGGSSVRAAPAVLAFQRRLGAMAVTTGTVLGAMHFTGWDSVVDGLGAQMRSTFTVSSAGSAVRPLLCLLCVMLCDSSAARDMTNAGHLCLNNVLGPSTKLQPF